MQTATVRPQPTLALIIPVLNESAGLASLLAHVGSLAVDETIIVDGGSEDGSWRSLCEAATAHAALSPLRGPRGRARQMNLGATRSTADILLFLHADTRLPECACREVRNAVRQGASWGRFDVCIDGGRRVLGMIAWMMNQRSALTGICTGDQAIFVRRSLFMQLGGYADIPLMEDIDLSRRLKKIHAPHRIASPATTSGRRWEQNGVLRTVILMWFNRLSYWLGVDPAHLARKYRDAR